MLRLDYPSWNQTSIMEIMLPKEVYQLNKDLAEIDKLLQNDCLEEPFLEKFKTTLGRGTVPIRPYIRLMYLKRYYGFGYETLVEEVARNMMLKYFCRIPMEEPVPDSTTLIKLAHKYGNEITQELNEKLIQALTLSKKNGIRGNRIRVDTTVVESNIEYPTDSNLLADCARAVSRGVKAVQKLLPVGEKKVQFHSKKTTMKNELLSIAKVLRRRSDETRDEVRKITGRMVKHTKEVIKQAKKIIEKLVPETKSEQKQLDKLKSDIIIAEQITDQAEKVNAGHNVTDRIISIVDTGARPIRKGKLGKKTEFGYKVQLEEAENGFVTGYGVYTGNPCDVTLLDDAIKRHIAVFDKVPNSVSADRGYWDDQKIKDLHERKIKNVCIPKRGKISRERYVIEHTNTFKRLKRWRAGIEGRISYLKREYGLNRSYYHGNSGTACWVGWGIFAHNLDRAVKMAKA